MTNQRCLGCIIHPVLSSPAPCRPCSDTEVLLAICTSDFGKSLLWLSFQGLRAFPSQQ